MGGAVTLGGGVEPPDAEGVCCVCGGPEGGRSLLEAVDDGAPASESLILVMIFTQGT